MYLDSHEREETQTIMAQFNLHWSMKVIKEFNNLQAWRMLFLTLLFFVCIPLNFLFFSQEKWTGFALGATFIVLLQLSYWRYKSQMKETFSLNSMAKWSQEIDEIDTTSQERQLFLDLLMAIQNDEIEQVRDLVLQAFNCHSLSKISFIRELYFHVYR